MPRAVHKVGEHHIDTLHAVVYVQKFHSCAQRWRAKIQVLNLPPITVELQQNNSANKTKPGDVAIINLVQRTTAEGKIMQKNQQKKR